MLKAQRVVMQAAHWGNQVYMSLGTTHLVAPVGGAHDY